MTRVTVLLPESAAVSSQKIALEKALIIQLLQGNEKALGVLFYKYGMALQGIIFRIVRSKESSEDVLQETFVKIWKNLSYFNPEKGRLFTWMASLARNSAIDHIRSKNVVKSEKNDNMEDCYHQLNNSSCAVHLNTDTIGLKSLTFNLPKKQLEILKLVYFEGFTHTEAATELNIPLGTAKTHIRMALSNLKKLFNERKLAVTA